MNQNKNVQSLVESLLDGKPYNIPSHVSVRDSGGDLVHDQDGGGYLDHPKEMTLESVTEFLDKNGSNAQGGVTKHQIASHFKAPLKAVEKILLDGARAYTISCHLDQSAPDFRSANRGPLYYFKSDMQPPKHLPQPPFSKKR